MTHTRHAVRGAPRIEMKGEPRYRSRSLNQVQRRTPGGKTVVHYEKPLPGKALCGICKGPLQGLPRGNTQQVKHFSRTELTIQRPFGANLCSSCSRDVLRWKARVTHKLARDDEVPIHYKEYIKVSA